LKSRTSNHTTPPLTAQSAHSLIMNATTSCLKAGNSLRRWLKPLVDNRCSNTASREQTGPRVRALSIGSPKRSTALLLSTGNMVNASVPRTRSSEDQTTGRSHMASTDSGMRTALLSRRVIGTATTATFSLVDSSQNASSYRPKERAGLIAPPASLSPVSRTPMAMTSMKLLSDAANSLTMSP